MTTVGGEPFINCEACNDMGWIGRELSSARGKEVRVKSCIICNPHSRERRLVEVVKRLWGEDWRGADCGEEG